jgi:hypothetical protein
VSWNFHPDQSVMLMPFLRRNRVERQVPHNGPELINRAEIPYKDGDRLADLEAQDLSYEDALLDHEVRSYMKTEYGSATAPEDAFYKLSDTIHTSEQGSRPPLPTRTASASPSLIAVAFASLQRYLARPALPRVVSTGLVLLLAFLAIDSRLTNLSDTANSYSPAATYSSPASSAAADSTDLVSPHSASDWNDGPHSRSASRSPRILYDPTYDDPQTWTPESSSLNKFNVADADTTQGATGSKDESLHRSDIRRGDPGPQ